MTLGLADGMAKDRGLGGWNLYLGVHAHERTGARSKEREKEKKGRTCRAYRYRKQKKKGKGDDGLQQPPPYKTQIMTEERQPPTNSKQSLSHRVLIQGARRSHNRNQKPKGQKKVRSPVVQQTYPHPTAKDGRARAAVAEEFSGMIERSVGRSRGVRGCVGAAGLTGIGIGLDVDDKTP
ncbi:hypothetical protein BDN70DRAFT_892675 [Pholiota conissans]|uniref:Uncharacterized protein n=1 Tax=Pholiota conissans TaxID=109636 RepID=A0A9P6D3Q0_9AGAR|nr:hypothetical protein BDN70DRAFT_892675 [Pholiota conissans]